MNTPNALIISALAGLSMSDANAKQDKEQGEKHENKNPTYGC